MSKKFSWFRNSIQECNMIVATKSRLLEWNIFIAERTSACSMLTQSSSSYIEHKSSFLVLSKLSRWTMGCEVYDHDRWKTLKCNKKSIGPFVKLLCWRKVLFLQNFFWQKRKTFEFHERKELYQRHLKFPRHCDTTFGQTVSNISDPGKAWVSKQRVFSVFNQHNRYENFPLERNAV